MLFKNIILAILALPFFGTTMAEETKKIQIIKDYEN